MMPAIKILIIDDHSRFRLTARKIISADPELQVIGESDSNLNALEIIKTLMPDLVLLNLKAHDVSGLKTLAQVKSSCSEVRCVITTNSEKENDLLNALRAGANGYLLKKKITNEFCTNLKKVMAGFTILQENFKEMLIAAVVNQNLPVQKEPLSLSDRELEVLDYLTKSHKNKIIANNLGISVSTVKMHIKHLLVKLNLSNREEVVSWASNKSEITNPIFSI
jgi:two-component system nitrate/nitrite response regulator NarL